ncbi:2-polyprenyl-3-methyl-6-methoxy-1,4-benzoquinone monooxygenase [Fastidiosibacter lacustris]|uniref:2-polyprenyl-3-methyl-6-methoxy-1,4-benzoquinone monooxygenase n=1 Tax=Fastidiosibacter lacustris TaxID=2056695 RepID=UPI000E354B7F|nr:2-polyprenyl-3-methyl-6-methoxy-1,4-benzoquinone monooxygenase [Fastidiosibacter lacustris]
MTFRNYSFLDQCLSELQHFIKSVVLPAKNPSIETPAQNISEHDLNENEKQHVAGLMRVDHTGEICAQALYRGQAFVARNLDTKAHLHHAAEEEYNHLSWCETRLEELEARKSLLNPFWYIGSFTIGATAGFVSDKVSYGFVIETEKQVMSHLEKHLLELPMQDKKSKAILIKMYEDEKEHADQAKLAGGLELPMWAKLIMKVQSRVMTTLAYRI